MRVFVKPMARSVPISFVCSSRLADIELVRLKRQRIIVMTMMTEKMMSRICLTCS